MNISPAVPVRRLHPTRVTINRQDPAVLPNETVTIGLSRDRQPSTRDYILTEKVAPDGNGDYLLDPSKDPAGFAAINVLANLQIGLEIFLGYCDQDKIPPTWWQNGPEQLPIYPFDLKGERNAFYTPSPFRVPDGSVYQPGVHCGVFADARTGGAIYTAHSGEFVGHEAGPGHALLHRFRPEYMRSKLPEVRAYHEAFGDVSTILTQLSTPSVLDLVARQTGGDLSKHNAVSDFGEQFGSCVNFEIASVGGPKNYTGGNYLRSAINDLRWQDPLTLPKSVNVANPQQLTSEAHNFCRIWTGAIYSILSQLVKDHMATGLDARAAIAAADHDLLKVYGKLTSNTAPLGDFTFADMAQAMLRADGLVGTGLEPVITAEMLRRGILPGRSSRVCGH